MDKREVAYTEARLDLLEEMLKAGAFDMDGGTRRDFVAATVHDVAKRHPEMDEHMVRHLIGDGIRATYGDATVAMAAREGKSMEG